MRRLSSKAPPPASYMARVEWTDEDHGLALKGHNIIQYPNYIIYYIILYCLK